MGPTWVLSAPGGLHVGPMNLVIWGVMQFWTTAPPLHLLDIHAKYQYISTYYVPDQAQYVQKRIDLVNYNVLDKGWICLPQDPIVDVQFTTRNTIYRQVSNIRRTESQHLKDYRTVLPLSWSQMLSREWRCSWSSADRRCSNYIWVIDNFIAY